MKKQQLIGIMLFLAITFNLLGCNLQDSDSRDKDSISTEPNTETDTDLNDNTREDAIKEVKKNLIELKKGLYSNEKGLTFDVPESWEGKVFVKETSNCIRFIFITTTDMICTLFLVGVYSHEEFKQVEEDCLFHKEYIIGKNDKYVFYDTSPVDLDLTPIDRLLYPGKPINCNFKEEVLDKFYEEYELLEHLTFQEQMDRLKVITP